MDSRGGPSYPTNKSKLDTKSEKYYVNLKLRRNPTSEKFDMYEFRMALCNNGDPEEFLLFQRNYKMALDASGTLTADLKI